MNGKTVVFAVYVKVVYSRVDSCFGVVTLSNVVGVALGFPSILYVFVQELARFGHWMASTSQLSDVKI